MAQPVISEMKFLGNGPGDFVEIAIPDDYPNPGNLRVVIYDRNTNLPTDVFTVTADGTVDPAGEVNDYTKYIVGQGFNGTNIRLHRDDAVGLYDEVTGETFGLYTFETGDSFTVSAASGDPFAGMSAVTLPNTAQGGSLQIDSTGNYTPVNPPTPFSSDDTDPLCFVAGTFIETELGPVLVEKLRIGDLLLTKDHGLQPIAWIGRSVKQVTPENSAIVAPYRIEKSAFSQNCPKADLTLSPQHMVLLSGPLAELCFDAAEVLAPVKALQHNPKVNRLKLPKVDYWHIATSGHDLVFANGVWSETLFIGPQAKQALTQEQAIELEEIFPELFDENLPKTPACRPHITAHEAQFYLHYASGMS